MQLPADVRQQLFEAANKEGYHADRYGSGHTQCETARKTLEDYGIDWRTNLALSAVREYIQKWSSVDFGDLKAHVNAAVSRFDAVDMSVFTQDEIDLLRVLEDRSGKRLNGQDQGDALVRLGVYLDYLSATAVLRSSNDEQQLHNGQEPVKVQPSVQQTKEDSTIDHEALQQIKEKWSTVDDAAVISLARVLSEKGFDALYDDRVLSPVKDSAVYDDFQRIFSNFPENIKSEYDAGKIARYSRMFLREYEQFCMMAGISSVIDDKFTIQLPEVHLTEDRQYYDIIKSRIPAERSLADDKVQNIAKAVSMSIANHTAKPDWEQRDAVKAQLRVQLKRVLHASSYPAESIDSAIDGIMNHILSHQEDVTKDAKEAISTIVEQRHLDTDELFIQNHGISERKSLRYRDGERYEDYLHRNALRGSEADAMLYFHDK